MLSDPGKKGEDNLEADIPFPAALAGTMWMRKEAPRQDLYKFLTLKITGKKKMGV